MARKRKLKYFCDVCDWSIVVPFKSALCPCCGELGIPKCHCGADMVLDKGLVNGTSAS